MLDTVIRRDQRMKICIVSDSHDRAEALEGAVKDAAAEGAQAVVHCGDLIGAHTLRPALSTGIPMHVIHGNNMGDAVALHNLSRASDGLLHYHGPDARLDLGGEKSSWCTILNTATRWPAPGIGTSCAAGIPTRRASSGSRR